MVHYYFSNVHVKHTWEEFVQALRKIGEYECADRIVREKKLEGIVHIILFLASLTVSYSCIQRSYNKPDNCMSVPFTNAYLTVRM